MFAIRSVHAPVLVRVSGAAVRVGTVRDSDVKALDDEISALDDRIRASIRLGVDGMENLLASHIALQSAWRDWLTEEGYDENLHQPWYRSETLGPKGERMFVDFRDRERDAENDYARIRASVDAGMKPLPISIKIPPRPTSSNDRPPSGFVVILGLLGAGVVLFKVLPSVVG